MLQVDDMDRYLRSQRKFNGQELNPEVFFLPVDREISLIFYLFLDWVFEVEVQEYLSQKVENDGCFYQ